MEGELATVSVFGIFGIHNIVCLKHLIVLRLHIPSLLPQHTLPLSLVHHLNIFLTLKKSTFSYKILVSRACDLSVVLHYP